MSEKVSPEFIMDLAAYADLPLPVDRAVALAKFLDSSVKRLRAIRPEGYEHLPPALSFHLPMPHGPSSEK
jgi:hypothetical protein